MRTQTQEVGRQPLLLGTGPGGWAGAWPGHHQRRGPRLTRGDMARNPALLSARNESYGRIGRITMADRANPPSSRSQVS